MFTAIVYDRTTDKEFAKHDDVIGYDTYGATKDGPVFQLVLENRKIVYYLKSKYEVWVNDFHCLHQGREIGPFLFPWAVRFEKLNFVKIQ